MTKKNIVIASDSFKGTLSSLDICNLFNDELKNRNDINPIYIPIADGGEGSLDAISKIIEGRYVDVIVNDLYFREVETHFYVDKDNNAYVEAATCVGLHLANDNNDPGKVSTYGLGEQILKIIDMGIKKIYIFLGGSASNDGGAGLASALGVIFYDKEGHKFVPTGLTLKDIDIIDTSHTNDLLKDINITILSDVKSPFYGPEGAAYKFAPQKGASKEEVIILDEGLKYYSEIINKQLHKDISLIPGSGAAGGLGGGLLAFTNATIKSGINTLLDLIHFDDVIENVDYVISGEGKLDKQTLDGKVIDGVAFRCIKKNKPLILIVGISEISLKEIQHQYPCIIHLLETNDKHLPFEEIKQSSKEDYIKKIKEVLSMI